MEYRFQELATDSNNFERAHQVQTLTRAKVNVAWPQTQIFQKPLNRAGGGVTSSWDSPPSLGSPSSQAGPVVPGNWVPGNWVPCTVNISDYKVILHASLLRSEGRIQILKSQKTGPKYTG